MGRIGMRAYKTISVILIVLAIVGCEAPEKKFERAKQIDEKVTQAEFEKFQRIVSALPDSKISDFPLVFLSVPQWDPDRSLPVSELVKEEKQRLKQKWKIDSVLRQLKKDRQLTRILRRKKLSLEKFIGLTLALGAALSRSRIENEDDLKTAIKKGEPIVNRLEKDSRSFSALNEEDRQTVLRNAIWITRMHRAIQISKVPPENLALIREHEETILKMLPQQFSKDPLASAVDLLEERGLPFEELKESGFDSDLFWVPKNAIIGTDRPDKIDFENR